jgi:hypothetical protein
LNSPRELQTIVSGGTSVPPDFDAKVVVIQIHHEDANRKDVQRQMPDETLSKASVMTKVTKEEEYMRLVFSECGDDDDEDSCKPIDPIWWECGDDDDDDDEVISQPAQPTNLYRATRNRYWQDRASNHENRKSRGRNKTA